MISINIINMFAYFWYCYIDIKLLIYLNNNTIKQIYYDYSVSTVFNKYCNIQQNSLTIVNYYYNRI